MIFSGLELVHGEKGDPVHLHYLLEHGYRWLANYPLHQSLWDPPFFFPVKNILASSETLIGVMPFYAMWRALGLDPETAYPLWLLLVSAANFVVMFAFLRSVPKLTALAATGGAYLFAFSAVRLNQSIHSHLWPQFYIVLALWSAICFVQAAKAARTKQVIVSAMLLAIFLALQFYSCFYWMWFFLISAIIASIFCLCRRDLRGEALLVARRYWIIAVGAGVLASLLMLPALIHYSRGSQEFESTPFSKVRMFLPHTMAWLYLGDRSLLYGWMAKLKFFTDTQSIAEKQLGIGLLTTAVIAAGFWWYRKDTLLRICLVVILCVILLTAVFPGGFTLYQLVYYLPGAHAARAVARWGLFLTLPLALAFAFGLQAIETRRSALAAALLLAAMVAEQLLTPFVYPIRETIGRARTIAREIPYACDALLYTHIPKIRDWHEEQFLSHWIGTFAGIPSINGHTSHPPVDYPFANVGIESRADLVQVHVAAQKWVSGHNVGSMNVCWIRRQLENERPHRLKLAGQSLLLLGKDVPADRQLCEKAFLIVLGRLPDSKESGLCQTMNVTREGSKLVQDLMTRPEFRMRDALVEAAYQAIFKRQGDYRGWLYWTEELFQGNCTPQDFIQALLMSPEGRRKTPGAQSTDMLPSILEQTKETQVWVAVAYKVLLGREADPNGRNWYLQEMKRGMAVEQMLSSMLSSPEYSLRAGVAAR
ncbi:MAG TPA: DUF4214 domain-containing protein [Bryobacteraceae bacterium]|nr:DUF4214 domain-containing protein [Bryobacteraceae bacterium]